MAELVDRLVHARELSRDKRVLDIGGGGMPAGQGFVSGFEALCYKMIELFCGKLPKPSESAFAHAYGSIRKFAKEYRIVDYHDVPDGSYLIDLNKEGSVHALHEAIDDYQPEVILCMETLEHLNYHYEAMNELARSISKYGSTVFITLPNNNNWVLNALGWNHDHSVAFFRDIAERFIRRSNLGRHELTVIPCMQKYVWYWWIVCMLSFFQPFAWGFTIRPKNA